MSQTVHFITVNEANEGQRLDNFLFRQWKGLPKSKVYQVIRKGEVRVNKKRAKAQTKLVINDVIRMPPVRLESSVAKQPVKVGQQSEATLQAAILVDTPELLVINKPAGWAVHGGSGISLGLIEALRQLKPKSRYLELAHRLDRDTSGCLILAKKRSVLTWLHEQFRECQVQKGYLLLVHGCWPKRLRVVQEPLLRVVSKNGERFVRVDLHQGVAARTEFEVIQYYKDYTFLRAMPKTGRTHQIRVHAASQGYPIVGDQKYAHDRIESSAHQKLPHARLPGNRHFLHCESMQFLKKSDWEFPLLQTPLPPELQKFLKTLKVAASK